ncbi:META domain-containing protein [Campylobacter sp. IFREMER_LSEM_CL1846]|uniref:META domain-containing protein n=1 Tax=Campylobacter sp. IFREMER_LSEM_CL1846 TaxID=2911614 RepID=UPI0021E63C20|nr:META domain-containing protein [Campylobacter sp. IFREMER_LSEM_CL1846]HEC1747631.1 META domain-containing protein [Campylobacter lari]MCV3434277.1 META domain-containing protein [Campylobacter sp. IFREMER_LSEM_CL1846]HEC1768072.1 META domain-containing protein [Campylobacter lari]HEC1788604.1 META domain-containing protein [Campylobacter lari]HEC1795551.1 META domain-containing protein [Campylobacter lari]
MKKIITLSIASLAIFSGCSVANLSVDDLQNKEFTISSYEANGKNHELPQNTKASISFNNKDKRVFGVSGCNRFFGNYKDQGSSIKIEDNLASTKMLCDQESMKFENDFLRYFNGEFQIISDDDGIILENKKMKIYLK